MFQEGSNQLFRLLIMAVAMVALAIAYVAQVTTTGTRENVGNQSVALVPSASVSASAYDSVIAGAGGTTNGPFQLTTSAVVETAEVSSTTSQRETVSNEVGATINNHNSIQNLPYNRRGALMFYLPMAGNATATDPPSRESIVKGFPNTSPNVANPNNLTRNWSHAYEGKYELLPVAHSGRCRRRAGPCWLRPANKHWNPR